MGKEFLLGSLTGFATVLMIFIILLFLYTPGCNVIGSLVKTKNDGCMQYNHQPRPCEDWTEVNVSWGGTTKRFDEFITENFGCRDEVCARRICSCPGYQSVSNNS